MQERRIIELDGGWSFMEVCCDPGQGLVSGMMRPMKCSRRHYGVAERHHEAQKHPGGRGRRSILSRAVHDALHVSGPPHGLHPVIAA